MQNEHRRRDFLFPETTSAKYLRWLLLGKEEDHTVKKLLIGPQELLLPALLLIIMVTSQQIDDRTRYLAHVGFPEESDQGGPQLVLVHCRRAGLLCPSMLEQEDARYQRLEQLGLIRVLLLL